MTLARYRVVTGKPMLVQSDGRGVVPSAHPIEGMAMINQAALSGRMDQRDHAYPETEREDDLGFAAGLRLLIPAGILLWIAVIYMLIHVL